jgi:hypothetical protein
LWRYLAESDLTYRSLSSLFAGESQWVIPDWSRMFRGRTVTEAELCAEIERNGRIENESSELDLAVVCLSEASREHSTILARELYRLLKPGATLLYSQPYGTQSVFEAIKTGQPFLHPEDVARQLESSGFSVCRRARYASSVVDYSEHDIFVCQRNAE